MGTYRSSKHRLKNGQEVTIRNASLQDSEQLIECVKFLCDDNEGQVWEPGEFLPTREEETLFIQKMIDVPSNILFVAEAAGEIIGMIDFTVGARKRLAHTGEMGMSVMPGWRDLGVGYILLNQLIEWAKANPALEKICLRVLGQNSRAIKLYEKTDFKIEGRMRHALKMKDGTYEDSICMALMIGEIRATSFI